MLKIITSKSDDPVAISKVALPLVAGQVIERNKPQESWFLIFFAFY